MIRNYIKTAFRSLVKNKAFTFINVLGLALGLATCLLIVFYVFDELSYDHYNKNYDRIYRVNTDLKYGGSTTLFAIAAPPVGAALADNFPEVEKYARLTPAINIRFKKGNENVSEEKAVYCDPGIFEVFTLPMVYGDPKTALTDPGSVVISESTAMKYFNRADVVGKTLTMATDSSFHKITGVVRDMPAQSHFVAAFFLPLKIPVVPDRSFAHFSYNTYILLKAGASAQRLEAKLPGFMYKALSGDMDVKAFEKGGNYIRINLIPLKDIHLRSNRQRELGANGNIQYVYMFSAIAIFILILACINFMNLSTARSAGRAREVGVRKVLGSPRSYLIAQFLSESVLITLAATVIAVLVACALLPLFNQMAGKQLVVTGQICLWLLPALLVIVVLVGILAGAYPALFLSAFKPALVLKGKLAVGFKGGKLRSVLVVLQFSISIFLVIGTLVIYSQLKYIRNKDLGFNRNQVLVVKNVTVLNDPTILKKEIKQLPGVINATLTGFLPTGTNRYPNSISTDEKKGLFTEYWQVDADYINTMGMKLLQGRDFNSQLSTDSSAVIINQAVADMMGYTNPLNKELRGGQGKHEHKYHIIGVVKDFNFNSLRDNVSPLIMVLADDWRASLSIKVRTTDLPMLLKKIESKWKSMAPGYHFEYSFMDEDFDALYRTEQRMGQLFILFTTLAIVIACLGLFGLAAYAAEQRNREIGIRKVLGASVPAVFVLLAKDFIKLIFIAIIMAVPVAWLVMQKWLQGFAYRQNMQWWVLLVTAAGAVAIAVITISFQSVKAALTNPVKSLQSE